MTPQQKRVLAASRAFNGTCSADWIDGLGADGKGKISRVPARIEELEELYGAVFEIIGCRNRTRVFRLVSEPDVERDGGAPAPAPPDGADTPSPAVSLGTGQMELVADSETAHWREVA